MRLILPLVRICVLLALIIGDLAVASGNNCHDLFDTTIQQQSQRSKLEFPADFRQIVDAHPITQLSQKLSGGEGLTVSSDVHVKIDTSIHEGIGLGEVIQVHFLKKLLEYIFPNMIFFEDYLAPNARKAIRLDAHDYAEFGKRLKNDIVNMAYLKSANPSQVIEGRRSTLRLKLGIKDGDRVVSLYGFGVSKAKEFYSRDNIITDLLSSKMRPKIIFVSSGIFQMKKPPHYIDPNSYKILTYSEFLKSESPLNPFNGTYIILNNTSGRMVEIYESADVAIVLGAINFFEPLNIGTPTISYMDQYYIKKFHKGIFKFLADIGQRTHGYRLIGDPYDLEGAYRDALKIKREDITPSYLVRDKSGKTPLDYLLDNVLELLMNSLPTRDP